MLALKLALPLIGLLLQLARRVTAVPGALRGRRRSFEALAVEAFLAAVAENELSVLAAELIISDRSNSQLYRPIGASKL